MGKFKKYNTSFYETICKRFNDTWCVDTFFFISTRDQQH